MYTAYWCDHQHHHQKEHHNKSSSATDNYFIHASWPSSWSSSSSTSPSSWSSSRPPSTTTTTTTNITTTIPTATSNHKIHVWMADSPCENPVRFHSVPCVWDGLVRWQNKVPNPQKTFLAGTSQRLGDQKKWGDEAHMVGPEVAIGRQFKLQITVSEAKKNAQKTNWNIGCITNWILHARFFCVGTVVKVFDWNIARVAAKGIKLSKWESCQEYCHKS